MAYATTSDMIDRFGAEEMIRLTTPAGQSMDGVVAEVMARALDDASARIDSYIRRRYETPLDPPPPEITDAACQIARFNLATGDGKTTSEEVRNRRNDTIQWLRDISDGKVRLDLTEVAPTTEETAAVQIGRQSVFR